MMEIGQLGTVLVHQGAGVVVVVVVVDVVVVVGTVVDVVDVGLVMGEDFSSSSPQPASSRTTKTGVNKTGRMRTP